MRLYLLKTLLFFLIFLLVGCSHSKSGDDNSMKGYFSYMADAALFTDCKTNKKYPVAMEGDYISVEKAYLEIDRGPGENVFVKLLGDIELRKKIEGEGEREFLIIKKLIEMNPDQKCN